MITDSPYIFNNVITYLGNKRKLISFINSEIQNIVYSLDKPTSEITFLDAFSGTGIISRLSRECGFVTHANDLEVYTGPINHTYLSVNASELEYIFKSVFDKLSVDFDCEFNSEYYQSVLDFLNSLNHPNSEENIYFAKKYSPKDTDNPDFDNERLFYTQENALFIDAIIEIIFNQTYFDETSKNIILTDLLYKMSVNINTSGVMKGFHNGWGGKGKVALNRILKPIALEKLHLIDSVKGTYTIGNSETLFQDNPELPFFDIVYADPPYNQHQYSANYHLLTTAVLNDRYDPGKVIHGQRAGIRKDHNKSKFCYKNTAADSFKKFVDNLKGHVKFLIVSYNHEGYISPDDMIEILSDNYSNTIKIKSKLHERFKGGKSTELETKVVENLFIVEFGKPQTEEDLNVIKEKLKLLIHKKLSEDLYILPNNFCVKNNEIIVDGNTLALFDPYTFKIIAITQKTPNENDLKLLFKSKLSNLDLMNIYLKQDKLDLALNLLQTFKIKKYEKEFDEFRNKIRNSLVKKEKLLSKIESHVLK